MFKDRALTSKIDEVIEDIKKYHNVFNKNIVVYVTKSSNYWEYGCNRRNNGLLIPALTGVPMVDSIPPASCQNYWQFAGLSRDTIKRESEYIVNQERICSMSLSNNFKYVYYLNDFYHKEGNKLINCEDLTQYNDN
jgi:hypothetical protein